MEILKIIKPQDFGIEESSAVSLTKGLETILNERTLLIEEYNRCIQLEVNEKNIPVFKALRLQVRDNRTKGIEKWHKASKDYFLCGGRFVDAIKNKESLENERMEEKLLEAEKTFENLEKERIAKIEKDRSEEIRKYSENIPVSLGTMPQGVFDTFLAGCKTEYNIRIEAAKQAEIERLRIEQAEKAERERIFLENERLKSEAIEAEKKAEYERLERENLAKIEAENRAKELAEMQAKADAEKKARDEAEAKAKAEFEAKIKAEREAKEKLEAEMQAKADAEKKARDEAEAKLQAELMKGDEDKIKDLIKDLIRLQSKYSFDSDANKAAYEMVKKNIDLAINNLKS